MAGKPSIKIRHFFVVLFDVITVALSLFLMQAISSGYSGDVATQNSVIFFAVVSLVVPFVHLAVGLYESKVRENSRNIFRRCILSVGLSFFFFQFILVLFDFTSPDPIWIALSLLLSAISHSLFRHWAITLGGLDSAKRRVVFIGAGERAEFIQKRMRRAVDRKHFSGWEFINFEHVTEAGVVNEKLVNINSAGELSSWLKRESVDVVVLADERLNRELSEVLLSNKLSGVEIVTIEDFVESEIGQIAVEKMPHEWLLLSKGFQSTKPFFEVLNYLFNVFLGAIVLLLTWPLMILAALMIYLEDGRKDRAPILYRQQRVGKGGDVFEIVKFRSMGKDAEKDGAQWASKNDMRVTRVGHYLRKYRIDELPQLLNVFAGEMTFVGPRPERPEFVGELASDIPYFHFRHAVKPGLTGWAQVKYPYGASRQDSFEKLKFDLYYVKHRSFLLDIFILFRTVETVLFGQGR